MAIVVGIDLGTTNSVISFIDGDEPKVIPNNRGSRITPSVVAFLDDGEVLVGESAKNQAILNPSRTITAVKRKMGSPETISISGRRYTPEEISAEILKKLKEDAESYLGADIRDAVVTVPAYFNETQRRATKKAGELAGFNVLRIINEPTAAALAYAYTTNEDKKILVYDLGGGTFDVTYLHKSGREFVVQSTYGNNKLGGIDFDRILYEDTREFFKNEYQFDIGSDRILIQQLSEQLEKAKIELSSQNQALVALPFVSKDNRIVHLRYTITREKFNSLIESYIQESINLTKQSVESSGDSLRDIDTLILSGGSSRIPLIQESLISLFACEPMSRINPEELVAMGAAIQAHLLSSNSNSVILRDVTPFDLGVEIENRQFVPVIHKNTNVPIVKERIFTTVTDNQTSVEIHILQGNSRYIWQNNSLGKFLLAGIRRAPKGVPQIVVKFRVDENGILQVNAQDIDTGVNQNISVTRDVRIDPEQSLRRDDSVFQLITRTEKLAFDLSSDIDNDFRKEITEIINKSRKATINNSKKELYECRIALETIVGELQIISRDMEEGVS